MASNTSDDDNKVVEFPKTAEERRALRKAKQDIERQKLVNCSLTRPAATPCFPPPTASPLPT